MKKIILLQLISVCFVTMSHAGLLYQYQELTLMDLGQMNKLVEDKIKESKTADAKTVPLKEALQAVYARPDSDRMIDKVILPLRSGLQDLDAYDRVISDLVEEALNALKHTRAFKPSVQVTYAIFLENFMADNRPSAEKEDGLERKLFVKIKKADIKFTKQALNERGVRGLPESKSPSEVAEEVLEGIKKKEEAAAKSKD